MRTILLLIAALAVHSVLNAQIPPPPVLQSGEKWTNLWSVSYDKQWIGSIRYIVQDPNNPANLCAVFHGQHDSLLSSSNRKYVYYSYSNDFGNTWTANVLDTTYLNFGYPCIAIHDGIPIISDHRSGGIEGLVYIDSGFGNSSFHLFPGFPANAPTWPDVISTSNGNILFTGDFNGGSSSSTTFNGTSWSSFRTFNLQNTSAGNSSVESGSNGNVSLYGIRNKGDGTLISYNSTDNGITFDNGSEIFSSMVIGNDTVLVYAFGGFQGAFSGDDVHFIFAVNKRINIGTNGNIFRSPRIIHWSAATGFTHVAGDFNIPNLCDTMLSSAYISPLCQPTIGLTPYGNWICSFTAYTKGNTQIVQNGDTVNAGDIYISYSNNNGASWSTPTNITNTPNVEEKHPSLLRSVSGEYNYLYYIRDLKAGNWNTNPQWGKAPVYAIVRQMDASVGIREINSLALTYGLSQNYPNPFNPITNLEFGISNLEFVTLKIYDGLGMKLRL